MTEYLQSKIDEAYPKYYDYKVSISKEQWIDLINDADLFDEENLEYLKTLYSFNNHAATIKEVSKKIGKEKSPQYYLGKINGLTKKVAKKLGIDNIPARDGSGSKVYWYVMFYGRDIKQSDRGVFEWKLRPELAIALKEDYPDLEYQEPNVTNSSNVSTVVWLGTAILAFNKFYTKEKPSKDLMYFKQKEIQKIAQSLCDKDVHSAMISAWCNADQHDSTYNYLREGNDATRRLSFYQEFNDNKEQPDLVLHNLVETDFGIKTIKEIKDFIEIDYTKLFKGGVSDIDYLSILNFLEKYADKPYVNPNKKEGKEKQHYLDIKNAGMSAVKELDKIAELCEETFDLKKKGRSKWLTGGNDIVRRYLWRELKYEGYEKVPTSISIVAEMVDGEARYKFAVELNDTQSEPQDYINHHRLLNKDIMTAHDKLTYLIDEYSLGDEKTPLYDSTAKVKKNVKNGKYKKVQLSRIITREDIEANNQDNKVIKDIMLKAISALIPFYELALGIEEKNKRNRADKNMILYGPPGTGKTYNTVSYAVSIIENKSIDVIQQDDYSDVFKRYNEYKTKGRVSFITFHQSFGYEEFIESIRPVIKQEKDENASSIQYEYSSGLFKKFCNEAEKDVNQNEEMPYVFIIDEINRGNISKIFGELITLIEDTKRIGEPEEIKTILPYTGEEFGVPKNVYIIGTMNTADRSIALMDTALRRRFNFIEIMPDADVLTELNIPEIDGINIPKMLKTINNRIEYLYDRDHTIGHSYFISLVNNPTLDNLANIFLKSIIPLLQEYFYEDNYKIQLVLGDNYKKSENKLVLDSDSKIDDVFKGYPDIDMLEKKYIIQKDAFYRSISYKEIY